MEFWSKFTEKLESKLSQDEFNTWIRPLKGSLQKNKLEIIKSKHENLGRSPLVKMTQGRINALEDRVKRERLKIDDKRKINYEKHDVCAGVIRVEKM